MMFNKLILGLITIVVLATGCSAKAEHPVASENEIVEETSVKEVSNTEGVAQTEEANLKEKFTEIDDIAILDEIKTGYIYFGRPDCPYCNIMEPILFEVLNELNLEIYYFETSKFKDDINFDEVLDNHLVEYVPTLIYKDNNEVIMLDVEDGVFFDEISLKSELIQFLN